MQDAYQGSSPAARILITGATVLTMDSSNSVYSPGEIAIEGNKLVYVGKLTGIAGAAGIAGDAGGSGGAGVGVPGAPTGLASTGLRAGWRPDRVIDGRGKLAMPGLVNTHTHAAMTLLRGVAEDLPIKEWLETKVFPLEDRLDGEAVYWGTKLAALEMIRTGTTTFADFYFFMEDTARAVEESGLRACLARGLMDIAGGGEERLSEARALYRNWHGQAGGRITTALAPHAPYTCSPAFLEQVVEAAHQMDTGIFIHVDEGRGEEEDFQKRYGLSQVAMLEKMGLFTRPVVAAHCVHVSEADLDILARNGVAVAHNPTSNMKLSSGAAPVRRMLEKGICVAIGTDGAASNNDLDMFEEMRLAALLQKLVTGDPTSLPAGRAVTMATREGAAALGLAGVAGRLESGLCADLILLDWRRAHFAPWHDLYAGLVYAAHGLDVETTIVDGRILFEKGRVLTLDEERILFESERMARRLLAS